MPDTSSLLVTVREALRDWRANEAEHARPYRLVSALADALEQKHEAVVDLEIERSLAHAAGFAQCREAAAKLVCGFCAKGESVTWREAGPVRGGGTRFVAGYEHSRSHSCAASAIRALEPTK